MKKYYLIVILILFVGFVPTVIFLYGAYKNLNIYYNRNDYHLSKMKVDSLDIGHGYGKDFNVYAIGKIKNIKLRVNIGKNPNTSSLFESKVANLNQDTIKVFYRNNGKYPIYLNNENKELNFNIFLKNFFINMIFPCLMILLFCLRNKNFNFK